MSSLFTRRNYIWLASVARDMRTQIRATTTDPIARESVDLAIGVLADALAGENPSGFDKALFRQNVFDDKPPGTVPFTADIMKRFVV